MRITLYHQSLTMVVQLIDGNEQTFIFERQLRHSLQNILSSKPVDGDADTQSASATGDELSKTL